MRSLALAAILSLAIVPAAFAKPPCRDLHGHLVKCAVAVRPPHSTICVNSNLCDGVCIPRYKICRDRRG